MWSHDVRSVIWSLVNNINNRKKHKYIFFIFKQTMFSKSSNLMKTKKFNVRLNLNYFAPYLLIILQLNTLLLTNTDEAGRGAGELAQKQKVHDASIKISDDIFNRVVCYTLPQLRQLKVCIIMKLIPKYHFIWSKLGTHSQWRSTYLAFRSLPWYFSSIFQAANIS